MVPADRPASSLAPRQHVGQHVRPVAAERRVRELVVARLVAVRPLEAVLAHLPAEVGERRDLDEARMSAHDVALEVVRVDGDRAPVVRPADQRAPARRR